LPNLDPFDATSPKISGRRQGAELGTIAEVRSLERRDELAELLTDQDVETLRHLVNKGMGKRPCANPWTILDL
jgi:hypothetical protein